MKFIVFNIVYALSIIILTLNEFNSLKSKSLNSGTHEYNLRPSSESNHKKSELRLEKTKEDKIFENFNHFSKVLENSLEKAQMPKNSSILKDAFNSKLNKKSNNETINLNQSLINIDGNEIGNFIINHNLEKNNTNLNKEIFPKEENEITKNENKNKTANSSINPNYHGKKVRNKKDANTSQELINNNKPIKGLNNDSANKPEEQKKSSYNSTEVSKSNSNLIIKNQNQNNYTFNHFDNTNKAFKTLLQIDQSLKTNENNFPKNAMKSDAEHINTIDVDFEKGLKTRHNKKAQKKINATESNEAEIKNSSIHVYKKSDNYHKNMHEDKESDSLINANSKFSLLNQKNLKVESIDNNPNNHKDEGENSNNVWKSIKAMEARNHLKVFNITKNYTSVDDNNTNNSNNNSFVFSSVNRQINEKTSTIDKNFTLQQYGNLLNNLNINNLNKIPYNSKSKERIQIENSNSTNSKSINRLNFDSSISSLIVNITNEPREYIIKPKQKKPTEKLIETPSKRHNHISPKENNSKINSFNYNQTNFSIKSKSNWTTNNSFYNKSENAEDSKYSLEPVIIIKKDLVSDLFSSDENIKQFPAEWETPIIVSKTYTTISEKSNKDLIKPVLNKINYNTNYQYYLPNRMNDNNEDKYSFIQDYERRGILEKDKITTDNYNYNDDIFQASNQANFLSFSTSAMVELDNESELYLGEDPISKEITLDMYIENEKKRLYSFLKNRN